MIGGCVWRIDPDGRVLVDAECQGVSVRARARARTLWQLRAFIGGGGSVLLLSTHSTQGIVHRSVSLVRRDA